MPARAPLLRCAPLTALLFIAHLAADEAQQLIQSINQYRGEANGCADAHESRGPAALRRRSAPMASSSSVSTLRSTSTCAGCAASACAAARLWSSRIVMRASPRMRFIVRSEVIAPRSGL